MTMKFIKNNTQLGTALISALILILFITSTISIWIHQSQSHIRHQRVKQENQQAVLLLQGINIWAAKTLKSKSFHSRNATIAKLEPSLILPPKGWKVSSTIEDAQNKFNLNNLNEPAMQLTFFLLLKNKLKNIPQVSLKSIFYGTIKKVEPLAQADNQRLPPNDSESSDLNSIAQPFISVVEWKTIPGVNEAIYQAMLPYLTALPETTPINVNTCDEAMLAALKPGLKKADVKKLIFARGEEGFKKMEELFAVMQDLKLPVQNITINSQYFWVNIKVQTPSHRTLYYQNLLYRQVSSKHKVANIKIVSQFQLH